MTGREGPDAEHQRGVGQTEPATCPAVQQFHRAFDAQLAAVPMHRYVAAFERLQRVTTADTVASPIPAG